MPFIFEGPITRTVEDAALAMSALAGYDSRDPYCQSTAASTSWRALRGSISGKKIAYTRDYGIFPVDSASPPWSTRRWRPSRRPAPMSRRWTIGIRRSQRELSDLWCRFIAPKQVAALEVFKRQGIDIRPRPPRRHAAGVLALGRDRAEDDGRRSCIADQAIRTEVFDALRSVLDRYDFLVSPTLACLAVDNATDGNTVGPAEINGEAIDPLIGWCMTYLINFIGYPAATVPAGLADNGLPVGMQIVGRRYADADVIAASAAIRARAAVDGHL